MIQAVIDTVIFKCDWPIEYFESEYWEFEFNTNTEVLNHSSRHIELFTRFTGENRLLGMKIWGRNGRVTRVRCSLARVLHGNNRKLIKSQEEADSAIEHVFNIVREFADTSSGIEEFTRIDVGIHFQCNPKQIIRAHRHSRYPGTKRPKSQYTDHSTSWDYVGRRIIMYDKGMEKRRYTDSPLPSNLLRVEIQLSKDPLKRHLGIDKNFPTSVDFNQCYHAFREIMIRFAPPTTISVPKSIHEALATMENTGVEFNGASPMELITAAMPDRTAREWRKKVSIAAVRQVDFDWDVILPEDGPPEFIDWN